MKILVFSDTHLYLPFDIKKFNFLKKIISKSDRVIINGDFFDGYMTSFDDFINSPWNQLFPLLKSKKAVYIFGNHDKKEFSDKRLSLFSDLQVSNYKLLTTNYNLIFTHGHDTRPTPDTIINFGWKTIHYGTIFLHFIRNILMKVFRKFALKIMYRNYNYNSKKYITKNYQLKQNEFLIMGHNHDGEIDEKNRFACNGAILYGFAQYLTINSVTAKITLHEEWYK